MNTNLLKNIISWLLILAGTCFYIFLSFNNDLVVAFIVLLSVVTTWIVIKFIYDDFLISEFCNLLFFYGILVSFSVFFSMAVVEVPYPKGAIIFNPIGIAIAFGSFFIASIPLLFYTQLDNDKNILNSKKNKIIDTPKFILDDDEWEEASDEDIHSGDYETS